MENNIKRETKIKNKLSGKFLKLEKELPLEKFIPSAFLIFLLSVFILSLITYSNIEEYKKNVDLVNQTNSVILKNESVSLLILKLSLLKRGYFITKDSAYLNSFYTLQKELKDEIHSLKNLTLDNNNQQNLISKLELLINQYISLANTSIGNFENENVKNTLIELTNKGQQYLNEMGKISQQIEEKEIIILDEAYKKANSSNKNIQLFIVLSSIFSFIVIGLSLYISNKLIKNKNNAEQRLINSYEELEDKVEERTAELKQSNEKLKKEILVREKIENTLRESEHRFRILADSAPVLIWMAGVNKSYNYFNKVWLKFTGQPLESEMGDGWTKGIHPDDFQRSRNIYNTAFNNREKFEMEYRLMHTNGEYCWILDKGVPRYEDNRFIGYVGCCIDIDLRKRNEKYLKMQYTVSKILSESKTVEEGSKKILEEICLEINWDFGIFWIVEDDKLKLKSSWSYIKNDAAHSLSESRSFEMNKENGLLHDVVKNHTSIWISDIQNHDNFLRKKDAIISDWNSVFQIPILNEGSVIAILEYFNRYKLPKKKDLLEVLESIGRQIGNFIERIKAEESLKRSYEELEEKVKERTIELANILQKLLIEIGDKEKVQKRLKLFAQTIKDIKEGVYITDLDHKIIFVNESFENMFGYIEQELLSKPFPLLNAHNISAEIKGDITNQTLKGDWKGDFVSKRKDGTYFNLFLSTSKIRNDEGKLEAIVGICQDITNSKEAEKLLQKRNSLLRLLNEVIIVNNKTFNLNEALSYSINKICQYTKWDVGHAYIVENDKLISSKLWNNNFSSRYIKLKEISESLTFKKDEDLPGKVFNNSKSYWISIFELANSSSFNRYDVFKNVGLHTGLWIPIIKHADVVGVLEFFKDEEISHDNETFKIIKNIGIELGSVFEKIEIIEKIKKSEKLLNDAQRIAKLGSWEWDIINNHISWSDELYNIYEIKPEEFDPTFEGYLSTVYPDDLDKVKNIIQQAYVEKKPFNYHHRILTTSKKIKTLKAIGEIFIDENGNVIRMFGTGYDITDIKEAEEKLMLSERQLKNAQQIAKIGSWEIDMASGIQSWSDEMYRIFGYHHKEIIPDFKNIYDLIHPEDKHVFDNFQSKLLSSPASVEFDYRIITKKGELKHLCSEFIIEYGTNKTPKRLYGSLQDITQIKIVEEELRKTNAKLMETQKELIHNEKLAALGRFSSGIAHEIRNPLANISSLAQIVEKATVEEKLKRHLKYILINADIANKIIKDLLNFASPEGLLFNYDNLEEVIDNVVESIKPRCSENNIRIIKDISSNLPLVYIDKLKLEAAFMNFASNSIDAMPQGGKFIIKMKEDKLNNEIVIDFIDTGMGISQENLDKILEPFFTTKQDGTGLGLGLAYQTIKSHNGIFKIESTIDKGTHIQIKLLLKGGENKLDGKNFNN